MLKLLRRLRTANPRICACRYAHVWPLRHWMRDYREKPTRPSIAGLPYVALSARNMEHSPLGVLVQHGLSQVGVCVCVFVCVCVVSTSLN